MNNCDQAIQDAASRRLLRLTASLPVGALALSIAPFLLSPAWADAECGVPGAGGVVVCDNSGTPASNANPYPDGIRYDINGPLVGGLDVLSGVDPIVGVDLTATGITIIGDGLAAFQGAGISVQSHAGAPFITGPIVIDVQDSNIRTSAEGTTSASQVMGIVANSAGPITITVGNSEITTTGDVNSNGVFATSSTAGLVSVDTTTSTITILGSGSNGIAAENVGGGSLVVTAGTIHTEGDNSWGISAGGSGATDVTSTGHLISTEGDNAAGIVAQTGAGPLTVTTGAIETQGVNSDGVITANYGPGLTDIDTTAAPITTMGEESSGILAQQYGDGPLTITSGVIETHGYAALGIDAYNTGAGAIEINTTAGQISTFGDWAYGVLADVMDMNGGPLTITSGQITTEGHFAHGLLALNQGLALTSIDATGGTIETEGDSASGVVAQSTLGAPIDIQTADILTAGATAAAVVTIGGTTAGIDTTAGTLSTEGDFSAGVFAYSYAPNYVATIDTGAIDTQGVGAYGVAVASLGGGAGGSITVTNAGAITSSGADGGGIVAMSYALDALGQPLPTGSVTVHANADVTATGQNAAGISASSLVGPVEVNVASGVSVQGGWSTDQDALSTAGSSLVTPAGLFIGSNLPAAGIVVYSGEASASAMTVNNNGAVGALNDRAITMGLPCAYASGSGGNNRQAPPSLVCSGANLPLPTVGSLTVNNNDTLTGYVTFWDGAAHILNNNAGALFDIRNFADTNGDGTRDVEAVSVSDFGGPGSTFNNLAGGLVQMAAVAAPTVDTTGQYLPTTGIDSRALDAGFYSIANAGVSQGQFVNLQTFNNTGVIDLRGSAVGNTLVMTSNPEAGGAPGTGLFVSSGGQLLLNTVLNAGIPPGGNTNSYSDMLIVDSTQLGTAPTTISVTNVGGVGALTPANGIQLVEVRNKPLSAAGVFTLDGDYVTSTGQQAVVGGAYAYTLFHNGVGGDIADGNWYLRSQLVPTDDGPEYQPGSPIYEVYPGGLLGLNGVPTLRERVGNRYWDALQQPAEPQTIYCKDPAQNFRCVVTAEQAAYYAAPDARTTTEASALWGLIEASHGHFEPVASTTGVVSDRNVWRLRAGLDALLHQNDGGSLIGGMNVSLGTGRTNVTSAFGNGNIATAAYGAALTLTWYGQNGFYLDAQGQANWFDSTLSSDRLGTLAAGNGGVGYTVSLEAGQKIQIADGLVVTPQAQLTYSAVDFDDFTDPFGARVSMLNGDSLMARLGVALEHESSWADESGDVSRSNVYGIANLYYDLLGETAVDVSGTRLANRNPALWGGIGIGGTYNWGNDKYSLHGEVSTRTSLEAFGSSYAIDGSAGLRIKF